MMDWLVGIFFFIFFFFYVLYHHGWHEEQENATPTVYWELVPPQLVGRDKEGTSHSLSALET